MYSYIHINPILRAPRLCFQVANRRGYRNMSPVPITLQPLVGRSCKQSWQKPATIWDDKKRSKSSLDTVLLNSTRRNAFWMHNIVAEFGADVDIGDTSNIAIHQEINNNSSSWMSSAIGQMPSWSIMLKAAVFGSVGYNIVVCPPKNKQGIAKQICNMIKQLRGLEGNYFAACFQTSESPLSYTSSPFDSETGIDKFPPTPLYLTAMQQKLTGDHKKL